MKKPEIQGICVYPLLPFETQEKGMDPRDLPECTSNGVVGINPRAQPVVTFVVVVCSPSDSSTAAFRNSFRLDAFRLTRLELRNASAR